MTMSRQIEFLAINVYLYGSTRDLLALGWQGLVMAVPVILLAIPGGHLADRFNRRWVLASMLLLTAVDSAALGVACAWHLPAIWIYMLLIIDMPGRPSAGRRAPLCCRGLFRPNVSPTRSHGARPYFRFPRWSVQSRAAT